MNKFSLVAILIMFSLFANSQVKNVNPNKNAEPWLLGGLRIPSQEEINKIPVIKKSYEKNAKDLPSSLDNSQKDYFRPIFSQTDGCCAQASGVAYNFTYEMNREKGTSADISSNQFPTHYTYNFLNNGDGGNGSWLFDGWEIISANGCPNVDTYGGLADNGAQYWMSGYDNYLSGKSNRVAEIFTIDVSNEEGLITLKHWMYDHLEGANDGSIVNFAAGISEGDYEITSDYKIIKWHNVANHAMTFVGWDDNIEYDYNNDGNITTDIDINGDGIVNMQDWERGALIMVNSWGTSWADGGKAYVMYKLLADPIEDGGIFSNKVYSIKVKDAYTPQLTMNIKMEHNSRDKIKIYAGVSSDVNATEPEYTIDFPLFNKQGGAYDMRGTTADPIEITLDITPLLNYVNSDSNSKFFLLVDENDDAGTSSGQIYDFSIVDNENNETICSDHNVTLLNNDVTILSVSSSVTFDYPTITTENLPEAEVNKPYSQELSAEGGQAPYKWAVKIDYLEDDLSETFPTATSQLTPNDNDDGFATKSLQFSFPFYGKEYNELYLSTDGSIIFEPEFSFIRSEDAIKGARVISIFASDLMIYPDDGDGIFYSGDENSATFKWKTSLYGNQSANIEFAVTLFPSGEIRYYYDSADDGLTWAAGISNGDRANYVIYSNSGIYNPDNERAKFTTIPFPIGMSVSEEGIFEGTPSEAEGSWDISFVVTDYNNISKAKQLTFTTSPLSVNELSENNVNVYPNPFNSVVDFLYTLEERADVNLNIFDVTGKCVKSIYKNNKNSGTYKLSWQPSVPAGIYFYKFDINGKIKTGKLIFN
ncbi:MAG: T9SS type A sorting domain-containing protein [Chlorobi bacterium]|nr:T9SS type A sorting domain-containing protein [Chlorobiota bacterium]